MAWTFQRADGRGVKLDAMEWTEGKNRSLFREGMNPEQIIATLPERDRDFVKRVFRDGKAPEEISVQRTRCFLAPALAAAVGISPETVWELLSPHPAFGLHLRRIVHVPGLRGNPERTYKTTAIGPQFPGTFENYVASVIGRWQAERDGRLQELADGLLSLELTWKVAAKYVDDTHVEIRVGRLPRPTRGGAGDLMCIADTGFGISQVLPVLTALAVAEKGQMVYLEQPEIHLHPRAQSRLGNLLVKAALRGVRVVAETHSSLLLRAIQALVAQNRIAPSQVALHWFRRRPADGVTEVSTAQVGADGSFGAWPQDFADVELESASTYLDAAEAHHTELQDV